MPFTYDANNRIAAFNGGATIGTNGTSYSFDGLGQRVKKATYYSATVFVYDAAGKLVAEYASDGQTGAGTSYITTDGLGTPRVMTDAGGGVRARHDYLPFGEEIGGPQVSLKGGRTAEQMYVSNTVRQQFTGQERDAESGLDYFLARDYQSGHRRFTSVDPLLASARITNPQTFNRYTYVLNNPLRFTDPLGLFTQGDGGPSWEQNQEEAKKRKQEEQTFSGTGCDYGTPGCKPAFNFEVTVTAEPQLATTDTQTVTDPQINTGVEPSFPSSHISDVLNSLASNSGTALGSATLAGSRVSQVGLGVGVAVGGSDRCFSIRGLIVARPHGGLILVFIWLIKNRF